METPRELEAEANRRGDVAIRRYDYDGDTVIAADFGPAVGELSVDVVDDTAIVVLGGQQFEFEVPAEAHEVTVNDGVLTIRG
ncbi:DUF7127 family protein [Halegenticoccus tardaugens]|uniref:DUF7127 family protein n=1 Tax=Halegenticoccus tardaugens TaxID=2071624 RepID=UPI00100A70B5|nr:hypothetical protein [Halegenticoccus tardaugens]